MKQKLILCEGRIGNDALNDPTIAAALAAGFEVTNISGFCSQDNKAMCYVTLTQPEVSAPLISPGTASFEDSVAVSMECATEGATIYYTTDGTTTPTSSSTAYSGPIELTATTTIKAIAIRNGIASAVSTKTYTLA